MRILLLSLFPLLCIDMGVCAEGIAFPVDWRSAVDSPASVAFLLDAPAGKGGFVHVADGHLVGGDGRRIRLGGVNVSMAAGLPSKEHAPIIAAHLAQRGVNCVRFHFIDQPAPRGILDPSRKDTQALDPAAIDRLDFFIAQLRDKGIYADINLNVARRYKEGDSVREFEQLGFGKGATYFDERLLELQRDYARQLLTHKNPYTGNEYRNEPTVALVELLNENSLVEAWFSDRLLGKQTEKASGTWHDIPPSYEKELTEKYNAWLTAHVAPEALARIRKSAGVADGQPVPRLSAKEFAKADRERFDTEASFYIDIERQYFQQMQRFLKDELKVRPPLLGTSDHNHGKSGYPLLSSAAQLDVVDGHVYWQHPRYTTEASGKRTGFDIPNTPMVDDPLHSTVVQLSRSAIAGKPYIISEVNHPFPAEHACEGIPILAAYACLHDWDGIFWYTLGHEDVADAKSADGLPGKHFDLAPDPVKMAQLSAGALMFLRGDVQAAKRTIGRSYTAEQVRQGIRLPWAESPLFTPGFANWAPLVHSMRIASFDAKASGFDDSGQAPLPEAIVSDTGQLTWSGAAKKQGVVAIDTDRSQALIGHAKMFTQLRNLSARVDAEFCAVTLSAMDDHPIAGASKMLLTCGSTAGNTGMRWNEKRTTLEDWGKPPMRIEPVAGTIMLRGVEAKTVTAQPLDGAGKRIGAPIPLTKDGGNWAMKLGEPATVWYVVTVAR